MKKSFKCKLGFHDKLYLGQQKIPNILCGDDPIIRKIYKCQKCGELIKIYLNIGYKDGDTPEYMWSPSMSIILHDETRFRREKIYKLYEKMFNHKRFKL
jgi:hypothetical protein